MTRRKRQVADFPPEFLDAWELAAKGELKLSFESEGKARNFRQQLHTFRKAYAQENGQASCAHWWNYDLVIKGNDIQCDELPWKKQLRDATKTVAQPAAPIVAPTTMIPASLARDIAGEPKPEPKPESAQDVALRVLGFKS